MITAFPKIFAIGTVYIEDLFDNEVEITEKIDGSQFCFGKVGGELYFRSKGAQIFAENPTKMFAKGVDYIASIAHKLPDDTIFYSELLDKPRHNVLKYGRVPKNNIILYGVTDKTRTVFKKDYKELEAFAKLLDVDVVPLIYSGKVKSIEELLKFMETESILGDVKIEGFVVKNYEKPFLLGSKPIPLMMGKYVSEAFKEVHRKNWSKENTGRGKWQEFLQSFRTEARWHKAIQHLAEKDELENQPRDIGKLMKEMHLDIEAEEEENVKTFLWNEFKNEVKRVATRGFPEFYKKELMKKGFKQSQ